MIQNLFEKEDPVVITNDEARRIALEYFAQKFPAWPRAQVQKVEQAGVLIRVSFYPESESGIISFFTRYTAEIDRESGEVRNLR